jgi:hypothetical protein
MSSIVIDEDEISKELLGEFKGIMALKDGENNYRQYKGGHRLSEDIISGNKVLKKGLTIDSVEYRDGKFVFNASKIQGGTNGMKVVTEDIGMRGTASFRGDVTPLA